MPGTRKHLALCSLARDHTGLCRGFSGVSNLRTSGTGRAGNLLAEESPQLAVLCRHGCARVAPFGRDGRTVFFASTNLGAPQEPDCGGSAVLAFSDCAVVGAFSVSAVLAVDCVTEPRP